MPMRIQVKLGWLVLLTTLAVVLLFGSINYYWVRYETGRTLAAELEKRGAQIARALAVQAVDAMLVEDRLRLDRLARETASLDEEIVYIFLVGPEGELVAHTFPKGFPAELLTANPLPEGRPYMMRRILDTSGAWPPIRDVVAPVAGGHAGFVHVGLAENLIFAGVRDVERAVTWMVAAFIVIGIVGSYFFIRAVTRPLEALAAAVRTVNLSRLGEADEQALMMPAPSWNPLGLETEVDRLAREFQQMVRRLRGAYRQLTETHRQLVAAEKLSVIGTIAAGMAHELNNPLAGLRNCVRRIRREPHNREQLLRYLAAMEESAERMHRVVKGLLDLSRPRRPEVKEIALAPLVERVLLLAGHKLSEADVEPRVEIEPEAATIRADGEQLEHVLQNLVSNACDSLRSKSAKDPAFEPELVIRAARRDGRVEIEVRDNGIGIPREDLPRLFEPFFSTKSPGQGTGLGLSIAQDIVRAHGGAILVESREGAGASFRVVLPATKPAALPAPA